VGDLGTIRHFGRALGADNEVVYREWLGIDPAEMARLRDAHII
jgi:hypothetical protein